MCSCGLGRVAVGVDSRAGRTLIRRQGSRSWLQCIVPWRSLKSGLLAQQTLKLVVSLAGQPELLGRLIRYYGSPAVVQPPQTPGTLGYAHIALTRYLARAFSTSRCHNASRNLCFVQSRRRAAADGGFSIQRSTTSKNASLHSHTKSGPRCIQSSVANHSSVQ